jgi:DNA-binding response OmpR family regulator
MERGTVLVIDDERDLVELVRYNLEREGFEVLAAADGESGLSLALARKPDVILLDRMMPGPDGIEVCRRLREEAVTADVPVILLTAKAAETDRVTGLEAGADDYVTKPFSPKELLARVRARLRRTPPRAALPDVLRDGDLVIDEARREVSFAGRPLPLTPAEFRILHFLAACPGRVMFRRSSPPGQFLLGGIAVRQRLLTQEHLREALALQERKPSRPLGEILLERAFLGTRGLECVLDIQRKFLGEESSALGRILATRKLATEFQVNEALRLQGRFVEAGLKPVPRLGEILLKKGALGREALTTALELQNFVLYRCPACAAQVSLHPGPSATDFTCPRCKGEIPRLFARMASALHRVILDSAGEHAVEIPEEVLEAAEDPKKHFGRYLLVRRAGRGGAGEVWRAWHREENRIVALKMLPRSAQGSGTGRTPFGEAEAVKRFFNEARAIADLDHPNIVSIRDYGTAEGCFYYAMPFIDGMSLERLLREREPMDEEEASLPGRRLPTSLVISIVRDVALALDYAHSRGICHRDVKPGNILVDQTGRPWLIDFGLARVARLGDPAHEEGVSAGTPQYMPPEQAAGDMEKVDALSDIYSLGAVLYELLSGYGPYADCGPAQAFAAPLERPPRPLEEIAPEVPERLRRIVKRAMARVKGDRFPRARDLAEELGRV